MPKRDPCWTPAGVFKRLPLYLIVEFNDRFMLDDEDVYKKG